MKTIEIKKFDRFVYDFLLDEGYNKIAAKIISTKKHLPKNKDELLAMLNNQLLPQDVKLLPTLPNLDQAYKVIKSLEKKKKPHILIVSDFDCDGISSAVMAYKSFTSVFKIPDLKVTAIVNRRVHGTGYNNTLVNRIVNIQDVQPVDVLISFDHGSSDEAKFKIIKEKMPGIKLIITDHHLPKLDNLPTSADAFVNPHISGETNEPLDVSGCATGFLTLFYIYRKMYKKSFREAIEDFTLPLANVGISTISDLMPLYNRINRWLVQLGINSINSFRDTIWLTTRARVNIGTAYSVKDISHTVGPLINSGNRTGTEYEVFGFLVEQDEVRRNNSLKKIKGSNDSRRQEVKRITEEVVLTLSEEDKKRPLCLFIKSPLSINGLIAGNVGEMFSMPSVCFNLQSDRESLSGSLRGNVPGFSVMKVMEDISASNPEVLLGYGGHLGAGGCTVPTQYLDLFRDLFIKYAEEQLKSLEQKIGVIEVDMEIPNTDINYFLKEKLDAVQPLGKDFEDPLFLTRLRFKQPPKFYDRRCEFTFLTDNYLSIKGEYWYNNDRQELEEKLTAYRDNQDFDVVFELSRLHYMPFLPNLKVKHIAKVL